MTIQRQRLIVKRLSRSRGSFDVRESRGYLGTVEALREGGSRSGVQEIEAREEEAVQSAGSLRERKVGEHLIRLCLCSIFVDLRFSCLSSFIDLVLANWLFNCDS